MVGRGMAALQQARHGQGERTAADGGHGDLRIGQRLAHQRDRRGLAEPGQQHRNGHNALAGISFDRPHGAGNDDEPRLRRIELGGGVQHHAAGTADHLRTPTAIPRERIAG